ncbi:rhodanese-like domain-containing protein [soil metagenome]
MSANTVSLAECRRLMEGGEPLNLIDVRTPAEFAHTHAVGARSVPLDRRDPATLAAERSDSSAPIYMICQSGARAAKACERLQQAGVAPVFSVEGGTAAWEKAGLPVERGGGSVISLERQVRIAAGSLVLLGAILAWLVHPGFLAIAAFIGAGLMVSGITNTCGMAMVLAKMPWNR